jgi:hypothetical protein
MNANELADELTKMFRGEEYDRLIHEIPNMLRQQQAEIEALKKEAALQKLSDFTQEVEAKYSDAWWKEVDEFNKQLKAQEK